MFEKKLEVRSDWLDDNRHFHDARYIDAFHLGVGDFFDQLGIGKAYKKTGYTLFNLGMNLDYISELFEHDPLRITVNLLDFNHKLIHLYLEMFHARTGVLSATNERLLVHVDLATRKSAPFSPEITSKLQARQEACAGLPRPDNLGRRLGIRR